MARIISPLGEFVYDENVKEPVYDKIINWLSATILFAIVMLVFSDAVGRYFFKPINGSAEIVALLLGLLIFSAFPLVTRDQQHICVGLLDHLFTGWVKRLRDFFVLIASLAAVTFMGWRLWELGMVYIAEKTGRRSDRHSEGPGRLHDGWLMFFFGDPVTRCDL